MPKISQNNKVAISAIALFIVSFSVMLFFLSSESQNIGAANVLSDSHSEKTEQHFKYLSIEPLFETYLKSFKEPLFVTDFEGYFEYTNQGFDEFFENNIESLKGKKFFDYVNTKDLSELAQSYTKIIQSGEDLNGIGPFRILSQEKEKLVILNAHPHKNRQGKVEKIVFTVKDLTDKAEELNENPKTEEVPEGNWIDRLYPKIEEIENSDAKLLVDKIGFLKK